MTRLYKQIGQALGKNVLAILGGLNGIQSVLFAIGGSNGEIGRGIAIDNMVKKLEETRDNEYLYEFHIPKSHKIIIL